MWGQLGRSTEPDTAIHGSIPALPGPGPDQLTFELAALRTQDPNPGRLRLPTGRIEQTRLTEPRGPRDLHDAPITVVTVADLSSKWRARETYNVLGPDEFTETFELAMEGKPFEVYSRNHFKRAGP